MKKILILCLLVSGGVWADDEYEQYLKKRIADSQARSAQLAQEREELLKKEEIESAKRFAQAEQEQKERFKKPDAKLGMTKDDVLNKTFWGKPHRVNTTTTKHGVREQWVYYSAYLYFENGILTAIQDSR